MPSLSTIYSAQQLHPLRSYDQYELLQPFTVSIQHGEWISLVGHNGSGKSTLARLISGLQRSGLELGGIETRPSNCIFPIVTQMTSEYLLGSTPYEDLVISYEQYGVPTEREQLEQRIDELLTVLELYPLKHVPIEQLSGGERQLVAFAGALLMETPCIIFDEITSMLSDSNKWRVCSLIRKLAKQQGIAVIWITQQLDELIASDTVWVMNQLSIIYQGKAAELYADYAGNEGACPAVQSGLLIPRNANKSYEPSLAAAQEQASPISLVRMVEHAGNAQRPETSASTPPLQLTDALLLKTSTLRLDYSFQAGNLYLIHGHNGAGKSTLLQGLAGIHAVAAGTVSIGGLTLSCSNWRGRHKWNKQALQHLQYVPQHVEDMWFCGTIRQELRLILQQYSAADSSMSQRIEQQLEWFGIASHMYEQEVQSLSIGQQKRFALAIAFSMQAQWLLLDEPFAGLDGAGKQLVLQLLAVRKQAGQGTIVVSHQLAELMPLIDVKLLLDQKGLGESEIIEGDMDAALFDKLLQCSNTSVDKREEIEEIDKVDERKEMHGASDDDGRQSDWHQRNERISKLPHLFDPRVLMLSMMVSSASLLIWNSWLAILLYAALGLAVVILLRAQSASWFGIVAGFSFMSAVLVLVGGLSFSPLKFNIEPALLIAQRMLSLFVIIVLGLPLLSLMTPFRLQRALQQSFAPLRKLSCSLDSYALLISLIFRFVPLLSARWVLLQSLSRTRFKQAGLLSWTMLTPLVLAYVRSVLKLAEQLATSLELRGYDRARKEPLLHAQVHWQRQDSLLLCVMIGMAAINAAIHLLL